MSASLDYGMGYLGYRSVALNGKQHKSKRYKENRRRKVNQFFRDFPNCYYCGERFDRDNRSLDHFVPRSRGGSSCFDNLVTACKECNQEKGNDLPSGMKTIPQELTVRVSKKWEPVVSPKKAGSVVEVGHARAWKLFPCY